MASFDEDSFDIDAFSTNSFDIDTTVTPTPPSQGEITAYGRIDINSVSPYTEIVA